MPTCLLSGYQRSLAAQVRKFVDRNEYRWPAWRFVLLPGHDHKAHSISVKRSQEIMETAKQHDGVHIFGLANRSQHEADHLIRPFFRLRWLPSLPFIELSQGKEGTLIAVLGAAIEEEDYWAENVQPKSFSCPLVLPTNFRAFKGLQEMWRLSESFNNFANLETAASIIKKFTREHRQNVDAFKDKKTPWVDDESWIWDDNGDRHGEPVFPENWKYSLKLLDGFHFDVSSNKKSKRNFHDASNRAHALPKGYLNVTPHGQVRGA